MQRQNILILFSNLKNTRGVPIGIHLVEVTNLVERILKSFGDSDDCEL